MFIYLNAESTNLLSVVKNKKLKDVSIISYFDIENKEKVERISKMRVSVQIFDF